MSATELTAQLAERGDDPLAHGCDILVGEGTVERTEGERQRERTPSLPHLGAGVDVEDLGRVEHLCTGVAHEVQQLARGHLVGQRYREILAQRRERPEDGERHDLGRDRREDAEVDRERRRASQIPALAHERVQLAEEAKPQRLGGVRAGEHFGAAAGVQERPVRSLAHRPVDVEAVEQRAEQRLGREEVGLCAAPTPGGRLQPAGEQRAERVVLVGGTIAPWDRIAILARGGSPMAR